MKIKTALRLLFPATAALLLPACFRSLTPAEAAAEELRHLTAGEALLQTLLPLGLALLLTAQAFIPALRCLYVAACRSLLRLQGTRTAEERARLLATYIAWLGLSAGVFLLLLTPSLWDDCYCPSLGLAGDFWGAMYSAVLGMQLLLLSLLASTLWLAIRWWKA